MEIIKLCLIIFIGEFTIDVISVSMKRIKKNNMLSHFVCYVSK